MPFLPLLAPPLLEPSVLRRRGSRSVLCSLLLVVAAATVAVAGSGCGRARIHPLVAQAPPRLTTGEPEVFATTPERPYREIAVITTQPRQGMEDEVLRVHLKALRRAAERAGADAVMNVRLLTVKKEGYVRDPAPPFPAVKQGAWAEYVLRGTAVVYDDAPPPAPVAEAKAVEPGATSGAKGRKGAVAPESPDVIEAAPDAASDAAPDRTRDA